MGQEESGADFSAGDWKMLGKTPQFTLWQNIRNPSQYIEEHELFTGREEDIKWHKSIYYLRKNHRSIVSALYMTKKDSEGLCSGS